MKVTKDAKTLAKALKMLEDIKALLESDKKPKATLKVLTPKKKPNK